MSKNVHFMSEKLDHLTPSSLLEHLYKVFDFDLDPCSDKPHDEGPNVKAKAHFTEVEDGLKTLWYGVIFMNPPYGREIKKWFSRARHCVEWRHADIAVCLVPARTDTMWWQGNIRRATLVVFIEGRLKFSGHKNSAPFPSALVVFGKITLKQGAHLSKLGWSVFQGDR